MHLENKPRWWQKDLNPFNSERDRSKWWNREASLGTLVLTTFGIGSVAGILVLRDTATAEADDYETVRALAEMQSKSITTDDGVEEQMRQIARRISDSEHLELYCADNQARPGHTKSIQTNHPFADISLIIMDTELCDSVRQAQEINLEMPITSAEIHTVYNASFAAFVLGHELGHDLLGGDEDQANCAGLYFHEDIAAFMKLPYFALHQAPETLDDCR